MDLIKQYGLEPFPMKVQSLSRTFIDKLFALCDYYLRHRTKRYSRHLYDIYKLKDRVNFDDNFRALIAQIKEKRAGLDETITPSSKEGIDLVGISQKIYQEAYYEDDYLKSIPSLTNDYVPYDIAIEYYKNVMKQLFG